MLPRVTSAESISVSSFLPYFSETLFSQNDYRRGYQNHGRRDDYDELFLLRRAELGASPILLHNGTSFLHGIVISIL